MDVVKFHDDGNMTIADGEGGVYETEIAEVENSCDDVLNHNSTSRVFQPVVSEMNVKDRIRTIMIAAVQRRQEEEINVLIDAIKNGYKEAYAGNVKFDNIKSKEEVLAILRKMREESVSEPVVLYTGMPTVEIDKWIAVLQD